MAAVDFPSDLVDIMADDYQILNADLVRRSQYEDNYVRQAKGQTIGRELHSFSFILKLSNLPKFRKWMESNGAGEFNYSPFIDNYLLNLDDKDDPDDEVSFDARIVGGAPTVELQLHAGDRYEGESYFTGQMTVEFIRGTS